MAENNYNLKFGKEIMNTAYSGIGLAPTNSAEHYYLAAHLGFNALKGDVRITKDNKLLMCHDPGITVDDDGHIIRFDKENHIKFIDYNLEYFSQFLFKDHSDKLGYNAKLCDFETYVRICKETGKIVYATLRNDKIETVVAEVIRIIKKYHMDEHCVINSFTYETISEVRKYSQSITVSQVIKMGAIPDKETVDNLYQLGNSIITFFLFEKPEAYKLWEESKDILTYIREKNIPVHMAQVRLYSDYSAMIQDGVQGFHLKRALFAYQKSDIQFTVTIKDGIAEFGNILDSDTFCADIRKCGNIVEIRNIKKNNSGFYFDDGLPALWMNTLVHKLDISCKENENCTISYKDNAVIIDTNNMDGTYFISVNI